MATAEFSKFADILSAALSQHHLSRFGGKGQLHVTRMKDPLVRGAQLGDRGGGGGVALGAGVLILSQICGIPDVPESLS